ncbi:MAG TPA: choice-of-anchor Q domain-containing protein [Pyrinomonadaceae bacterium]|nr:choice-of-anchor Q domain-containing protein [Pyrinomonadaceae bacterium]
MKLKVVILTGFIFLFLTSGAVFGATFTVTKTADTNDGVCDADCSFREAVARVNANIPGGITHRIEFSTLFNTPQTIFLGSSVRLNFNTKVEIIGRGNHATTFTSFGVNNGGVLEINSNFARIINLRFANSQNPDFQGGAITGNDGGELIIEKCVFENNEASGGGAIYVTAFSVFTIKDSTFRNNQAIDNGGAIFADNYDQTITSSTFSGNQSANGSAVFLSGVGFATTSEITNSTFSGNTSTSGSTIVHAFNSGVANFKHITVANNTATAEAVYNIASASQTNLANSIVSLNSSGNINISVTQNASNLIGGNPLLGALANNGGETQTLALLTGSPAIDAGSSVSGITTDQRGAVRPNGTNPDFGAFESGIAVTSANTPTGANVNASLGTVSVTFSGVTQAGTTTQIPISPTGTPPNGYSFGAGFPAFQISTTAQYTSPITICLTVPLSVPLATFNTLEILHFENGSWVALLPTTRDVPTYTICAPTNSLSPFAAAQNLNPTAANVEISGRVFSENGVGAARAKIFLTDQNGVVKTAITNSFGVYRFDEIPLGTYTINVSAKQTVYSVQVLNVNESMQNLDFYPINLRSK